jgi:aryl-phospho-beta-D-glucosidase BglC (GH1 family)
MAEKLFLGMFDADRKMTLTVSAKSVALIMVLSVFAQLNSSGAPNSFLNCNGTNICNNYGQGDVVPLRGVNVGSWLLMEGWMSPMDSSGLADQYSVVQTLNTRFGVATQENLLKTYQEAWFTTNDLDNIKALGMNCVRLPFWWGNVQRLDGSWRTDAFDKMDWLVTNAWNRGIYTIIDFHGVPGGQSTSDSTAQANQNQYWTSATFQNQTSLIWSNVAAHFKDNPAVAGYDLMNEPFGAPTQAALWSAYTNLYQVVRAVDSTHIIIIEGTWSGAGLNWEWNVLPNPTQYGWTNVVYSMHAYAGDTSATGEKAETDKQVNDFKNHQVWNVPCFIGEFNSHGTQSAWQYSALQYDQNNMSWANWAYKAIAGGVGNSWGIYDPTGTWPPKPNIQTDSASSISNKWSQWKTSTAFGITPFLRQYLGAPLAVADSYTNSGSGTLLVNTNSGVLANDQDINLGLAGISLSAVLVGGPTNGQLTLNTNGAFSYTPNGGFNGIDTFRYRVFDGYVNSANIATASILVLSNTNGPATQLIWSTQPGLATNGVPFGQQPLLQTADALGNPSTSSLPASLIVTVAQSAGHGQLLGTTNFNIGTSGSNGVVHFANLQINSAGINNQLLASVPPTPPVSRLANGNFNSPNSTTTPTGWTTWTYGAGYANHEVITPAASVLGNYDGTYQMTLGAANTTDIGGTYQTVSATAGLTYYLSVNSGVQNWWWPYGEMRLFFYDAGMNGLQTNILSVTTGITAYDTGKPYQQYQLSATAPVGTTQAKVEFVGHGGGSVWFDNAVLIESNSTPAFAAAATLPFTVYSVASQTNSVLNLTDNKDGTFTLNFMGTVGATYYVQSATNLAPPINWQSVAGSTNTVTNSSGLWFFTATNFAPQTFYRSAVGYP